MVIINSVRHLAYLLGLNKTELRRLAMDADSLYSPFLDRSRSKPRVIDRPELPLRQLQRKIYDLLLRDYDYGRFAIGGVVGRSLRDAVSIHQRQSIVIRVDIRNFYPSISDRAVFGAWRRLGHGSKVAGLLTRLTTYKRYVPQGAPTSMALANLYMKPVDQEIFASLRQIFPEVHYTRWVDDMIFSGALSASVVFGVVARHLRDVGLKAHRGREKRCVMPRDARQEILGNVVNDGISLSRQRKRLTRAIIHTAKRSGGDPQSVKGHIEYLRSFHASLADQLEDSIKLAPVLRRAVGPAQSR